ncbi:MAG TPA: glycoside hydrolase family 2 TIM barrel-domain containing protein [Opitutaceae bacterium]|jgi:beta-galactosidase
MSKWRLAAAFAAAGLPLPVVHAWEIVQPARAPDDPPTPVVIWVGGSSPGPKTVVNAGFVCEELPASASAADIQGALKSLRASASAHHVDADRVALFGDGAGAATALMAGLTADPAAPLSALGVLSPIAPEQVEAVRADIRPDAPAIFLTEGQDLSRTLTEWGVPYRIEGKETAWRRGLIDFLHQNVGYPAHGLPPGPAISSPRLRMDLDPGWRFFRHDNDHGADVDCDDSKWDAVSLPHTWNARDGQDGGANYYRGAGWYRRHLNLDAPWSGKQIYLQFDGACFQADVYVNGKKVGTHLGGFARFRFDVTDSLQPRDNVIAVRVDNSALGIPPTSADFTFFGGLYRSVSLIGTDPIQISTTDYGSDGVFVDQTMVTAKRADIFVRTDVENYQDKSAEVDVLAVVYDAEGQVVAHDTIRQGMGAGDGFAAAQKISFEHPHLWNARADPYLYTVLVTLRSKGRVRDAVAVPLGLRSVQVDADRGFLLNGHYLDLHGVNRHQDRVDQGWAISAADEAEDFSILSDLGCTVMRTSHYQQSQSWYERCDRTGIVVWTEIPFVNAALPDPSFLANAKQQLHELILQNYNHPSICFWGVGNETKGAAANQDVQDLAELAKTEDGSRLTTLASNEDDKLPKNWHTDFTGFNHYDGWYGSTLDNWPTFLDGVHKRHPHSPIGISEYGAGASIYEHALPPRPPKPAGRFHPEEYQAYFHERVWPQLAQRPFIGVKLIWCLFDFASDGRSEGDHVGRNDKGLVTYSRRTMKDAYYYYQANWSSRPVVALGSRRFLVRHETGTAVKVYSNARTVELFVNGKSLGERTGNYGVFDWPQVRLAPGGNTASAVAHFGAETVADGATWVCDVKGSK